MAGKGFFTHSSATNLTAATAKTLLDISTIAGSQIYIREVSIGGNSQAGGTDSGVRIQISRVLGAETAVASSSTATIVADDPLNDLPFTTTALSNITTEPSGVTILEEYYIQPEAGLYRITYPLNNPLKLSGGNSTNLAHLYITALAAASETLTVTVRGEE